MSEGIPRNTHFRGDLESREAHALANMIDANESRIDALVDSVPAQIETALETLLERLNGRLLSEEERTWTKLAIQREAQSIKLRQAIIEKSLTGLVWLGIVGLGLMLKEWATNHGYKP